MKTCANCLWVDKCPEAGKRCEDYTPVHGEEYVAIREYEQDLKERADAYQEVIDEQNS